jgi:hypothetical protein
VSSFSDTYLFGLGWCPLQDHWIDQTIVENRIGLLDRKFSCEGDKAWVTWSGADEGDGS